MRRRRWFRQEFQGGVGLTDWDTSKGIWSHMTPCANMYSEVLFRQIIIYKFSALAHSRVKCYTTFQGVSAVFKPHYFEKFHPKFSGVNFWWCCINLLVSPYSGYLVQFILSPIFYENFLQITTCLGKTDPGPTFPKTFLAGKKWWWQLITCFLARWSCVSRFLPRVDDSGKPRCMPTGSTVDSKEPFISSGSGLDRDWI